MRIAAVCTVLSMSASAFALDLMWQCEARAPVTALPAMVDANGDDLLELAVPVESDGSVMLFSMEGRPLQRMARQRWISSGIAVAGPPPVYAFEESTGRVNLINVATGAVRFATVEGGLVPGAAPCLADLDADGDLEVLCVRAEGVVTALSLELTPLWQFDIGVPIVSPIAVGPVFNVTSAVYVLSAEGALYAVTGGGRPLWRTAPVSEKARANPGAGPLLLQLADAVPTVLYTDAQGGLRAVDAIKGHEQWRVVVGDYPLGTPAVIGAAHGKDRRIVVVGTHGDLAVVGAHGTILERAALPPGEYAASPLVADIDWDDALEVIVAARPSRLIAASLRGEVRDVLELRGDAVAGPLLMDVDDNRLLELVAATDRAAVYCWATRAAQGWTHPRGDANWTGCVPPIDPVTLPLAKRKSRGVRIRSVTTSDYDAKRPFGSVFVEFEAPRADHYAAIAVRQEDAITGSARKLMGDGAIAIPFVQGSTGPLTLDIDVYAADGEHLASAMRVPVRPGVVRLRELEPTAEFVAALNAVGEAFRTRTSQRGASPGKNAPLFRVPGARAAWEAFGLEQEPFIAGALAAFAGEEAPRAPVPMLAIGGNAPCTSLALARTRGGSEDAWGVTVSNRFRNAEADTAYCVEEGRVNWDRGDVLTGADCGHSASLEFRLLMAAYFSGADLFDHQAALRERSIFAQENRDGHYTLSSFGANMKRLYEFSRAADARGAPFMPMAFLASREPAPQSRRSAEAILRHVYAWDGRTDFESGFLTNGSYGEMFDVVDPGAGGGRVSGYGAVWPLEPDLGCPAGALIDYVRKGGILILDANQAALFPSRFLGATFAGRDAVATQIQTALGATPPLTAPYRHAVAEMARNTDVLAWTDTGAPLLACRRAGKGILIFATTRDWLDVRGDLLPLAPLILRALANAFLPVQLSADVQMFLNQVPDGWIIALVNNNGVAKSPFAPAAIDPNEVRDCLLVFQKRLPLQFLSLMGDFRWNSAANGLQTRLDPGGVAVVKAIFSPAAP